MFGREDRVTRDPRVDTRALKYILAHRSLLQHPVVSKLLEMRQVIFLCLLSQAGKQRNINRTHVNIMAGELEVNHGINPYSRP